LQVSRKDIFMATDPGAPGPDIDQPSSPAEFPGTPDAPSQPGAPEAPDEMPADAPDYDAPDTGPSEAPAPIGD
jgi:hypothetical protein